MNENKAIIKSSPNKRFGKPCIRNTRITVEDIFGWLDLGMSYNQIISDFPELKIEDIIDCVE